MISEAFNPNVRDLTNSFPKWSGAYADPNSNTNKLLNPFANVFEYLSNTLEEIHQDAVIHRVDVDKHPYKRWLVTSKDISDYDTTEYEIPELYLNDVSAITTTITSTTSGITIPLIELTDETQFYKPEMETGWFVEDKQQHYVSGTINGAAMVGSDFFINVVENGDTADPGELHSFNLPDRWFPTINVYAGVELTNTEPDPIYETIDTEVITTEFNTRVLLPYQIEDRLDKLTVVDEIASTIAGEEVLASGITITDTSDYTVGDTFVADFDNDGIIDQVEIDAITAQLGKSKSDFTDEEWETYKTYDINGNELIDNDDLNIVVAMKDTVQRDETGITIPNPGSYTVRISIPTNGYAATRSIYNGPTGLTVFQNETYGYLPSQWPAGYVDVAYDQDKELYYYLDNDTKAVWAYEENILGGTLDRIKIQLPILTSMKLQGIHYYKYRIYVLVTSAGTPYVITLRTDRDDIAGNITIVPIHSGASPADDPDIRIRDFSGVTSDAVGLCMINNAKLATVDEGYIKILLPIYDYFFKSADAEDSTRINFREKYHTISPIPAATFKPIYQNLWNMLDVHGEEKGLKRIPGENNISYKKRTLDVYLHFPSRDNQGSRYGMLRELGLDIVDSFDSPELNLLPATVDREIASGVTIFDDGTPVDYDEIKIENQYRYGKYTHDKISYISSGTTILTIDKDIIE